MFQNIIIPVDLSEKQSIKIILSKALEIADKFKAKLHFIYIISDFGIKMVEDYLPKNWAKVQKEKYQMQMQELVSQYVPKERAVEFYVGRGAIYDKVIQYTNDAKGDLIIISAVRPQFSGYMLGPNASKIVRHASVSVLVIRE
ncbi:universal stress protein [Candidatus Tisiphia endosymbiont of Nemotelus uliginosus]|uniref:universal stress protein n=1 Tax=Candidatus Tisiphia endosymbiont of Nemotelus uliginosus TaxID=3077926 RepID=UPI0035C912C4